MRIRIVKRGNSAAVRIRAQILAASALSIDQEVEIREKDGGIVIAPGTPSYDIDALLDRMTPESFPDHADFGMPLGMEGW